jgi:hypothetical protein
MPGPEASGPLQDRGRHSGGRPPQDITVAVVNAGSTVDAR